MVGLLVDIFLIKLHMEHPEEKKDNTAWVMTHPASVGQVSVRHFRQERSPSHTGLSICVSVRECVCARKWESGGGEGETQQEKEAERGCLCASVSQRKKEW